MGTDIHLWVECREHGGAPWALATPEPWPCSWCSGKSPSCFWCRGEGVESTFGERNYRLFGALAGVRGDCEPISEPRGWPDDLSEQLRGHIDGAPWPDESALPPSRQLEVAGEHSASWLSLPEIVAYFEARPECGVAAGEVFMDRFIPACLKLADDPADVRIVFNFDS